MKKMYTAVCLVIVFLSVSAGLPASDNKSDDKVVGRLFLTVEPLGELAITVDHQQQSGSGAPVGSHSDTPLGIGVTFGMEWLWRLGDFCRLGFGFSGYYWGEAEYAGSSIGAGVHIPFQIYPLKRLAESLDRLYLKINWGAGYLANMSGVDKDGLISFDAFCLNYSIGVGFDITRSFFAEILYSYRRGSSGTLYTTGYSDGPFSISALAFGIGLRW